MKNQKKRQKQVLAILLGITVSLTNIMSIAATTVGKPSQHEKIIEVTFKAGDGGYFSVSSNKDTNSTHSNASKSNIDKTEWVQIFKDLEENDQGCFTNLLLGNEEVESQNKEPVWKTIANKANENKDNSDDLAFAGWYYEDGEYPVLVSDYKEIYSDVTLNAGWYNPKQIKGEDAEYYKLMAIGLKERNLISHKVKTERNIEELTKLAAKELFEKKLKIDGKDVFPIAFELIGKKEKVTITLTIPENKLDPGKSITAIHEMDNGNIELIPTDVIKADDGNTYKMTFTTDSGNSFYFVNTCIQDTPELLPNFQLNSNINSIENQKEMPTEETKKSGEFGDNLTWKLEEGILTISGSGAMPNWDYNQSDKIPWNNLQKDIETIIIEDGITTIGDWAFYYSKNLVNIILPNSMTSIGGRAFFGCENLTSVELPDSVLHLGYKAFADCANLTKLKGACGDDLQWEWDNKNTMRISGKGTMFDWDYYSVPWYSFVEKLEKVIVEDGVTEIGKLAFFNCTKINDIKLPNSLVIIRDSAFSCCTNLTNIELPDNITNIESHAFSGCTNLINIELPDNLTNIDTHLFSGCSNLKSIKFSKKMETIKSYTFENCTGLTSIELPDNIMNIDSYAFSGCSNLSDIKFSKNMTTINSYTFENCTGLINIEFPNNITNIDSYAFSGCTGLTNVEFSDNITSIGRRAFYGTSISSVVIPESVIFLGQLSFPEKTKITYKKIENLTAVPLKSTSNKNFIQTTNKHAQNYSNENWSSVVNSYLYEGENETFYRVEYTSNRVFIEQYKKDFTFVKSWSISKELPKFGGFFAGDDEFYLAFGQDNSNEKDDAEVIRIIKYSKDMKRLDSVSLYGINTKESIAFSSLRMDKSDTYLYLHTGHTMYKAGAGHQSNLTIVINTDSMTVSHVSDFTPGYVSHSLNQFIKVDEDTLISVDQGDAFPRGVVMTVYPENDILNDPTTFMLLSTPEEFGYDDAGNYIGISIGGFECSDTSYLTVGNSINQDKFATSKTRNIFLSVLNKNDLTSEPEYIQVTNYKESDRYSPSTPQLVKISKDLFAIMWEEMTRSSDGSYSYETNGTVKIAFFDGEGKSLDNGKIGSFSGDLSDCQPILLNNQVTWYVTDGNSLTFYSYPAKQPDSIDNIQVSKKILKYNNLNNDNNSNNNTNTNTNTNTSSNGGSGGGGGGGGGATRTSASNAGPGSYTLQTTGTYIYSGSWVTDGQYWKLKINQEQYAQSQWALINGKWYIFNPYGRMLTGWQNINHRWYMMNNDGAMLTGWILYAGKWYYLMPDGVMATGWIFDNNHWYCLAADGAMYSSTVTPDGYLVDANGAWIETP